MSRAGHRGDIPVIDLTGDSGDEAEECSNAVLCPICFEHLHNEGPVATICGHLFCFKCLRNSVKISSACSLCKKSDKRAGLGRPNWHLVSEIISNRISIQKKL